MGHVTTDRIEEAWKKLKTAERLVEEGQTYGAVMKCENALQDIDKAATGLGEDMWFAQREQPLRGEIFGLKRTAEHNPEKVLDLIEQTRSLVNEAKEHLVPIINERIDYETDARLN